MAGYITTMNQIFFYGCAYSALRMLVGACSFVFLMHQGLSVASIGWLKAFQFMVIVLLDIPLSYVADRWDRKLPVLLASIAAGCWLIITAYAQTLWHFFIAEFFNALSMVFIGGSFTAYLIDSEHRPTEAKIKAVLSDYHRYNFGLIGISACIGVTCFDMYATQLWLVAGLLCILLFVWAFFALPSQQPQAPASPRTLLADFKQIPNMLNAIDTKWIALIVVLTGVYYQIIIQLWQPVIFYTVAEKYQNQPLFYGLAFLIVMLAQSLGGHLIHKKINTNLFLVCLFATSYATVWVAHDGVPEWIFFSLICVFMAIQMLSLDQSAKLHARLDHTMRSTIDSIFSVTIKLCLMLGFPMTTWIFEHYQVMGLFMVLFILTLIIALIISRRTHNSSWSTHSDVVN